MTATLTANRICLTCKTDISHRRRNAKRCVTCAEAKSAASYALYKARKGRFSTRVPSTKRHEGYPPDPDLIFHKGTFVIADVETSGLTPASSDIVRVSLLRIQVDGLGGTPKILDEFDSFVKPPNSIPATATKYNGITNEMVAGAPSIQEILPTIHAFIGDEIVVGHSVKFDVKFLEYAAEQNGMGMLYPRTLCTLELAKKYEKGVPNYRLQELFSSLFLFADQSDQGIDAKTDVRKIFAILVYLIEIASLSVTPTVSPGATQGRSRGPVAA